MILLNEIDAPVKRRASEILLANGFPQEALPLLIKECATEDFRWHSNMGAANRMLGNLEEAKEHCKRAISLNSICEKAWYNLALIMEDFGEFERAREAINAAYSILPIHKDIAYRYAMMNMRFGDWKAHQDAWDFAREDMCWTPLNGIKKWYGEPLKGKRVLVLHEGGYGDFFWLARYFKLLKEMGTHVTMNSWAKQTEFTKRFCPYIDEVAFAGNFLDETRFDYQVPLWSLLGLHAGPLESEPYFEVEETAFGRYGTSFRVGLVWEATEPGVVRKFRSIPLESLQELKGLPVNFVSLGMTKSSPLFVDKTLSYVGWERVPYAIDACDLVVSVDTAIAHLAGAMGKETILLLPMNSDWKWGTPDNSWVSNWYPQMSAIRNNDPLDWSGVIEELGKIITAKVNQCAEK